MPDPLTQTHRTAGPWLIFDGPAGPTAFRPDDFQAISPLYTPDGGISPGACSVNLTRGAAVAILKPAATVLAAILAALGYPAEAPAPTGPRLIGPRD